MAPSIFFLFLICSLLSNSVPSGAARLEANAPTESASTPTTSPGPTAAVDAKVCGITKDPTACALSLKNSTAAVDAPPEVQKVCRITKDPTACALSLKNSTAKSPADIAKFGLSLLVGDTIAAQDMVRKVSKGAGNNPNLTLTCDECLKELNGSLYRLELAIAALPTKTKDVRAVMSKFLANSSGCYDDFLKFKGTVEINNLVSLLEPMSMLGNNLLWMVRALDLFGSDTEKWAAPKTERDGFFEPVKNKESTFPAKFPTNLKIDATVSKDGQGYKTVQEAVDIAPINLTKKFVIKIKAGIYDEIVRVPSNKTNLVFLGDGIGKTVITGKLAVGPVGISTLDTATVAVSGDGFMAKDITFKNFGGVPTTQAVAFRASGDKAYFENCEFLGYQDTLYCHVFRQFFKSCRIEGNVDFIFGNAAAYFKDCEIFINPRQETPEKGAKNMVTAHSRKDPGQSTGFVFDNCTVKGTPEYMKHFQSNATVHKNYLGRPWKEYARTVFINCFLDYVVSPAGWVEWKKNEPLNKLYYGEFENRGPGSDLKGRVPWSSKIPAEHVLTYSAQNFIQADEWAPRA